MNMLIAFFFVFRMPTIDAQSYSNLNLENANDLSNVNLEMTTVDLPNTELNISPIETTYSSLEDQGIGNGKNVNEHDIEKIEYENELRAISEILGIKFTDTSNKTLDSLKGRLTDIINEVKQDKENDNAEERNNLVVYLEGALYTLRNVTGKEALNNLKSFRHQLETISRSITDKISSILERFTPRFSLFGDSFADSIGKFADNFSKFLNTLKSESKKIEQESTTTETTGT